MEGIPPTHWDVLGAIDFTTIEIWTKRGLVTLHLLFVMEIATRQGQFAGSTTNPDEAWMKQIARNLTDHFAGFVLNTRHLLLDRDTKFGKSFRSILRQASGKPVRLRSRSPNLNPHLERFLRSLKDGCPSRMILFGETSLRRAVRQFLFHYHRGRNDQGLGNRVIEPREEVGQMTGDVVCRECLSGLLRFSYLHAA